MVETLFSSILNPSFSVDFVLSSNIQAEQS